MSHQCDFRKHLVNQPMLKPAGPKAARSAGVHGATVKQLSFMGSNALGLWGFVLVVWDFFNLYQNWLAEVTLANKTAKMAYCV